MTEFFESHATFADNHVISLIAQVSGLIHYRSINDITMLMLVIVSHFLPLAN